MIDYCIYDGELYHFNPFHDNLGRFASSRLGRTYVNRDGTLTNKAKRRLNITKDSYKGGGDDGDGGGDGGGKKKKKDKIRVDKNGRVVQDDIDKAAKAIHGEIQKDYDFAATAFNKGSDIANKTSSFRDKVKSNAASRAAGEMDLSSMSNDDLNNYIKRAELERRYRDLKASEVKSGKDRVDEVLEYAGAALGIAASATAIAAAIHQIKAKEDKDD